MQKKKTVVIGVCGGIAAYKALDIVSKLVKEDIDVLVIMTKSALHFVGSLSFQSLSANKVVTDMFEEPVHFEIEHIALAKMADLILVAPATANMIGKVANGIADDMLSTTIMAARCPVLFAPAMNTNMYSNPIVQENIMKLQKLGYKFISPASGRLACGDVGKGKLADTSDIEECVLNNIYDIKDLKGKRVLVTAGPTIAPIDPVRFITNRSSGKMGYAIAREALARGAEVILVSGPTKLKAPVGAILINVHTNSDMYEAVMKYYEKCDIVIKAAAVSDYKPKTYSENKIKKSGDEFNLALAKDTDILKKLGELKKNQILVGFAAESNDLIENAQEKLRGKNLDYLVANDITKSNTGFAADDNEVTFLCNDGRMIHLGKMSKRKVARELFNIIVK